MNFKEVQRLLKMMNVDMNEDHALRLFQVHAARLRGWGRLHSLPAAGLPPFLPPSIHPKSGMGHEVTLALSEPPRRLPTSRSRGRWKGKSSCSSTKP